MKFVHTFPWEGAIIILVKTPQYIIYFLLYPIVKIPSPKKTARAVFFSCVSWLRSVEQPGGNYVYYISSVDCFCKRGGHLEEYLCGIAGVTVRNLGIFTSAFGKKLATD